MILPAQYIYQLSDGWSQTNQNLASQEYLSLIAHERDINQSGFSS